MAVAGLGALPVGVVVQARQRMGRLIDDFPARVRRIVLRPGGRVWAEGVPEEGATFWFAVPAREG